MSIIKKEVRTVKNFKASKAEYSEIKKNAKKFAGGNISLWLRTAGQRFKPTASCLRIKVKT